MTRTALIAFLCKLPDYYVLFMAVGMPCLWMVWEMVRPWEDHRVRHHDRSRDEEETR